MSTTLISPQLPGREIVHMTPDAAILTPDPRTDAARIVGDMTTGAPDVADNTVVPAASPIGKVADTRTTLPRGS